MPDWPFFPPDGPDEQWLEYCGKNGRIAITAQSADPIHAE